jgi:hypothetical protein
MASKWQALSRPLSNQILSDFTVNETEDDPSAPVSDSEEELP